MSTQISQTTPDEDASAILNVDPETNEVSFIYEGDATSMRNRILRARMALFTGLGSWSPYPFEQLMDGGQVTRRYLLPKGCVFAAPVARRDSVQIVAGGDISFLSEYGISRLVAGAVNLAPAGVVSVGYANEDTYVVNVFNTDETDPAVIQTDLVFDEAALGFFSPACH